jgi:hypothetical protein
MENVGTWNADLAILLFALFLLPLAIRVLILCFDFFNSISFKKNIINQPVEIELYYTQNIKTHKTPVTKSKIKKSATIKNPTTIKKSNIVRTPHTNTSIQKDAVAGLKNLGIGKKDAVSIINKCISLKSYNSAEDLFSACLLNIK